MHANGKIRGELDPPSPHDPRAGSVFLSFISLHAPPSRPTELVPNIVMKGTKKDRTYEEGYLIDRTVVRWRIALTRGWKGLDSYMPETNHFSQKSLLPSVAGRLWNVYSDLRDSSQLHVLQLHDVGTFMAFVSVTSLQSVGGGVLGRWYKWTLHQNPMLDWSQRPVLSLGHLPNSSIHEILFDQSMQVGAVSSMKARDNSPRYVVTHLQELPQMQAVIGFWSKIKCGTSPRNSGIDPTAASRSRQLHTTVNCGRLDLHCLSANPDIMRIQETNSLSIWLQRIRFWYVRVLRIAWRELVASDDHQILQEPPFTVAGLALQQISWYRSQFSSSFPRSESHWYLERCLHIDDKMPTFASGQPSWESSGGFETTLEHATPWNQYRGAWIDHQRHSGLSGVVLGRSVMDSLPQPYQFQWATSTTSCSRLCMCL